jgi:DNA-binding MarR family transcriptional regulator
MKNEFEGKTNEDLRYIIRYTDKKNEAAEQLLKQSPSNDDLRYIIEYTDKKNEAWEQLLKQSPSNDDLRYIIRYTDKKNEAWEQLLKQSPSNYDLRYIIEYTDKKNEAAEQLLKQSPSNEDLRYIIRYTDGPISKSAAAELRSSLGITVPVDEEKLIKEIAQAVTERPGSLEMSKWHCGTTHCIAGWACVLNPIASELEKKFDTETAGHAVLPSYAKHFYSTNEEALELLNNVLTKQ